MKFKIVIATVLILCSILLSGCVEQQDADVASAVTDIRIGDAPTDEFKYLNITFSEVRLHSNETGWINETVSEENGTIDLIHLHLQNITDSLTIIDMPLANYTKLWIVIDNATGVLKNDSRQITLKVPSNILKIQQLFKLAEGENAIIIDIDLNASILKYKGGEEYKLLPVLAGISHQHNNQIQFKEQDKNKLRHKLENRKPVINILVNGNITNHIHVSEDEDITFNASATFDIDGDPLSFEWDFGDGNTSTLKTVSYNYSRTGTYHVTLTVKEMGGDGLEETDQITVTVKNKGK